MESHPNTPNESFSYSYSATQQEELKRIRNKYVTDEREDKWERLQRLDASVTEKAQLISLILGILGALILGVGMCCVLVWGTGAGMIALGVAVGLVGIAGVAAAYPVYLRVMKKQRDLVAPEILRLTEELMQK